MPEFLVTFFVIFAALYVIRQTGFFSPIGFFSFFVATDVLIYYLIINNLIEVDKFSALPIPNADYFKYGYIFSAWLIFLAVVASIKLAPSYIGIRKNILTVFSYQFKYFETVKVQYFYLGFCWAAFLFEVMHFILIDKSLLWSNDTYLLIANPTNLGLMSVASKMLHFILPFIGLFSFAGFSYWKIRRKIVLANASLILALYPFIWALAQNSRWAPLFLVVAFIIFFFNKRQILTFSNLLFFSFLLLVFLKVLIGRNTSYQGIAGIIPTLAMISFDELNKIIFGMLSNLFQGAQNFANAAQVEPIYSQSYMLLALSPFISAIDGYENIRQSNQVMINLFAPINAFAEVWHFGFVYISVFSVGIIFWLRQTTKLWLRDKDLLSFILLLQSYFVIFALSQYSTRTTWRIILIVSIVATVRLMAKRK